MQRDNPDSKNFLNAQIAFLESLKNKDRLEAIVHRKEVKRAAKKKSAKKKKASDEETKDD